MASTQAAPPFDGDGNEPERDREVDDQRMQTTRRATKVRACFRKQRNDEGIDVRKHRPELYLTRA